METTNQTTESDNNENKQVHPYAKAPESKKKIFLVGLFVSIFGAMLQAGAFSTMLPMAAQQIGGMDYYSAAGAISGVLSIVLMPLFGYLSVRSPSIKIPLTVGSFISGAVSMLAVAFAPSMIVIMLAMAFYSPVTAAIFVLGYSIIRDMYRPTTASTYIGVCGMIMMLGMLIGPIGGGALMTMFGWQTLPLAVIPFLVIGAVAIMFSVKAPKEDFEPFKTQNSKFDMVGAVGLVLFLCGIIMGLSFGKNLIPFGTLESNLLFVVSIIGFIILAFAMKKRGSEAIIPTTVLRDRNTVFLTLGNIATNFSNMALFFFIPGYVITVMGYDGLFGGIAVGCMSLAGVALGGFVGSQIGKAESAKTMIFISGILRIVIAVALLFYLASGPTIIGIYVFMLLAGVYNIMATVSYSAGPQVQIPEEYRVQGNSLVQTGQNFGSCFGTGVYTMVMGTFGLAAGMSISIVISIVCAALVSLSALFLKKL